MRLLLRGAAREQVRAAASSSSTLFDARRTLAAAATSSQKRALNPDQLQGKPPAAAATAAAKPPGSASGGAAAAGSPAAPRAPIAAGKSSLLPPMGSSSSGASSSSPTPIPAAGVAAGAAAVAAAGGAYYYYYLSSPSSTPASSAVGSRPASSGAVVAAVASQPPVEPAAAAPAALVSKRPAKEPSSSSSSALQQDSGHRVASIQVPDTMKGASSAPAPAVVTSPPDGHRVTSISLPKAADSAAAAPSSAAAEAGPAPPGDSSAAQAEPPVSWSDPSMTQRALFQLRTATLEEARDAVVSAHQSLWSSHAAPGGGGGAGKGDAWDAAAEADEATLRTKVAQLAAELSERTRWEAVRLKEFLALKEQETAQKYLDVLQTQRLEFEDILARRLREQEHQLSTQFQQALAEKEASIQTLLKTALETQQAEHEADKQAFEQVAAADLAAKLELDFSKQLEEYKSQVAQDLQQKVATVTSLAKQLAGLESALAASRSSHQGSLKAHKLSAAALALSQKLETSQPAGTELVALQAAAGDKGVIPAALRTIPPAVYSHGAATLPELQARFDDVYKQCRRAAMVPAGRPGLEGQLAGIVFSSLKYPPGPDDAAPEDQPDHPEYVLARAKKHVQLGELELAVEQLDKLAGQVAFTASDWRTSAMNRVAVEKALRVVKLECALVNESLVE